MMISMIPNKAKKTLSKFGINADDQKLIYKYEMLEKQSKNSRNLIQEQKERS